MMTIEELLLDVGLPPEEIASLLREIRAYNAQHPGGPVPEPELKGPMDQVLMIQLPFIGRAIAGVRGDQYLDSEGKFPLDVDENAMRYAAYKLDKYFRNAKKDQKTR